MGVLARLQDALANPEVRTAFNANPARTVEGYELLPEAVQNALNVMGDHELEHLANALDALMKEGFYVDSGYGRVAFF